MQVARRYPAILTIYKTALRTTLLGIGKVYVVNYPLIPYTILFPTKTDWRQPSRLEYIQQGLVSLNEKIALWDLRSVAVPALGCGLGCLDWQVVQPLIVAALANSPAEIRLYAPKEGG